MGENFAAEFEQFDHGDGVDMSLYVVMLDEQYFSCTSPSNQTKNSV